jgi:diguanylate cyclase (GGDEF)-like protein
MTVMNSQLPLRGEVAGESDREIRNIRILLCAAALMGVVALAVPSVFSHLHSAIYFLPQMMIGLAVLVLIIYLHFALQRKLLRDLSTAWLSASAYTERLEQFSFIDPQTELFNRRYLDHLFERQLKWVNRTGKQSTLLLFQVTSEGQKMSLDEVVLEAAYILRSNFRGSDYIVRSGSNQFVVLLPETADIQARFALNRLRDKVDSWNLECTDSGLVLQHELTTCSPGGSFWDGLHQAEERMRHASVSAANPEKILEMPAK